jgi:hypothetical protein
VAALSSCKDFGIVYWIVVESAYFLSRNIKNQPEMEASTMSNGWLDKCTSTQEQELHAQRIV